MTADEDDALPSLNSRGWFRNHVSSRSMLVPCVDDGLAAASAAAAAHPGADAAAGGGGAGGPGGGFPGAAARCQRSAPRGRGGVQPGEQRLRAAGRDAGAAGGTAGPGEFAAALWDVNIIIVGVARRLIRFSPQTLVVVCFSLACLLCSGKQCV